MCGHDDEICEMDISRKRQQYAQCLLGYCYKHGNGVGQDNKQAVYWYRKAAEQGHADAQNVLKRLGL